MKQSSLLFAVGLLCASAVAHAAPITIAVTPWLAPNAFGSPSFATAQANALYAEEHGLTSYGAAGPTQYNANSTVYAGQAIVTSFTSWMGVANPTGAYANEYGNRFTFGLAINGNGTQFSISELSFGADSSDPADFLGFGGVSDPDFGTGQYDYSPSYVGVQKGADGILGTADDIYITGGAGTQLVDALYSRGTGNSYPVDCPGCTPAQEQAAIDAIAAYPGVPFTYTGTYTLTDSHGNFVANGAGTFNVLPTPEPSSLLLMGTGAIGMVGALRRRFRAV